MRLLLLAIVAVCAQAALVAQDSKPTTQPTDASGLNAEALRLVEAKKFDEALVLIEKARRLQPSDEVIVVNYARVLTRRAQARFEGGSLDSAEADLVRALEAAPKETLTRVQLAIVLRARGEQERASREIDRALSDDPRSASAWEEKARVAYDQDELIVALEALETALKLDPSRKAALQAFRDKIEKEKVEQTWYPVERGSFLVKYDDKKFKDVGEIVLGFLDAAESKSRSMLGHVPSRKVTVVLYSREDFTAATGAHAWAGGLFDGKIRLPVRNFAESSESIRHTIAHEYTHLVVRDLCRKCPVWLNEGLAQIAEEKPPGLARELLRSQRQPRSVTSMPASWVGIQDARQVAELYAHALLFTTHLVSTIGYQGIKDVLLKTNGATTFEAAFSEVAGKTLEEAEAEWRAATRR